MSSTRREWETVANLRTVGDPVRRTLCSGRQCPIRRIGSIVPGDLTTKRRSDVGLSRLVGRMPECIITADLARPCITSASRAKEIFSTTPTQRRLSHTVGSWSVLRFFGTEAGIPYSTWFYEYSRYSNSAGHDSLAVNRSAPQHQIEITIASTSRHTGFCDIRKFRRRQMVILAMASCAIVLGWGTATLSTKGPTLSSR